ncbi:hypothetical protein [Candidatus Solincola tengchongensis]|uniref:hypothetical protein n=1 Tax=Candidatus Solincola tengchongensis TaxID=2900693 RepID=UPI00257FFD15|nr:hypothetical protein [Candidatus Solincola tengchongensis]
MEDIKGKVEVNINEEDSSSESVLAGMIRELIRSPGFKELVNIHLRDMDPASAGEAVRAFLWEDVGFSMGLLGSAPKVANWLAEALVELGVQLNNFTRDILRDFLVRMGRELDLEKVKAIPGAYAPLLNELLLEDREALDALLGGLGSLAESVLKAVGPAFKKVGNTADFGKVRVGLTEHFERRRRELQGEPPLANPVALSNLLGVVPPLVNYLIRVLTRTLEGMKLPAEILANAVFQLLEDIDQAEVGGLVNALSDFVATLHRGNMLLGRDEPRFKEVLRRVSRRTVDAVDGEKLREALVALGEDGKVVGEVVSEYLYADTEATARVAGVLYAAVNAALRGTAEFLRHFAELPPEGMERMVAHYREAFRPREAARVVNYNAAILNKAFRVAPDLAGETLGEFLAALDREQTSAAGKALFLKFRDALLSDPGVQAALQPEALGERINAALAAFNRRLGENPSAVAEKVVRTLKAVDGGELRRAAAGLLYPLFGSLMRETDLGKRVWKAAMVSGGAVVGLLTLRWLGKRRRGG